MLTRQRCCCVTPGKLTILGCLSGYPGLTVTFYDEEGGTEIAEETTDENGQVDLPGGGSWVVVTPPNARWASYASETPGGEAPTIQLVPATDYHCSACCQDPLYKTLNWSGTGGLINGASGQLGWGALTSRWFGIIDDYTHPLFTAGIYFGVEGCYFGMCEETPGNPSCISFLGVDSLACPESFEFAAHFATGDCPAPTCN